MKLRLAILSFLTVLVATTLSYGASLAKLRLGYSFIIATPGAPERNDSTTTV